MKANAVIFTEPNTAVYDEISVPDPTDTDVVVDVKTSWISNGTEGSFLRGERIEGDVAYREGDPWPFPIVAGYQKVGVVTEVGSAVSGIEVGEKVFATVGKVNGMFMDNGGQVSPSVCDQSQIWKIPSFEKTGVDLDAYSGAILAQVGYNCGARPPVKIGDFAMVVGDGLVGQWAAQTLWWRGAHVVMLGHHDTRLSKFMEGGPEAGRTVINTGKDDADHAVMSWLDSSRVSVLVDTVGSIDVINQYLPLMRRFGHVVSAGFYGTQDMLALQALRNYEIGVDLVSGWQPDRNMETIELISRSVLKMLPLVTHRFPSHQAAEAWRMIEAKDENVLGVLLDWRSDL